jgi:hypothetical protein
MIPFKEMKLFRMMILLKRALIKYKWIYNLVPLSKAMKKVLKIRK